MPRCTREGGRQAITLLVFLLALVVSGCSFGPKVLELTHGKYNESVREVEEEELLRNLVRLRYNEPPLSLTVSSIAAQYELSAGTEARPFFAAESTSVFGTFSRILPFGQVSGSNRPTFSLDPADDSAAVRQYLTPIPAETLIFLTQTSWPVSTVMRLWVERLNGVPNATTASGPARPEIPDFARFLRLAELFQYAQDNELAAVRSEEKITEMSGPLPAAAVTAAAVVEAAKNNLEYRPRDDGKTWVLIRRERQLVLVVTPGAENHPVLREAEQLMNLVPGRHHYNLVATTKGFPDPLRHPTPPSIEIQYVPRSTSQVYFYLANGVEVPVEHLHCGLVRLPVDETGHVFDMREVTRGLFAVHARKGLCRPKDAYVAVKYRGWWFWIDNRDQTSKATFNLMLQLSRLDFARRQPGGRPVLTLPAGR